jgi:hypothetical protein
MGYAVGYSENLAVVLGCTPGWWWVSLCRLGFMPNPETLEIPLSGIPPSHEASARQETPTYSYRSIQAT